MKLASLIIDRVGPYDNRAGTLQGRVSLTGESGNIETPLSAVQIGQILAFVSAEIQQKAKAMAENGEASLKEASAEALLKEQDGKLLAVDPPY